jgi:hypothetical protein
MVQRFELYVALGDSMSIDRYPSLDLLARTPPSPPVVAALRERAGSVRTADLPVGAASLLARNADAIWPEYTGRDLASLAPRADFLNLTMDGAMLPDVLDAQLPEVPATDAPALVTLTVGGNDLLMAYGNSRSIATLERAAGELVREFERCVGLIQTRLESARVVLTTVYDPSDGTGFIPGLHESAPPLPVQVLDRLNAHIRRLAAVGSGRVLADVHAHFLGHGARAATVDRWYWPTSMIEPGARGASEIRGQWLEAAGFRAP